MHYYVFDYGRLVASVTSPLSSATRRRYVKAGGTRNRLRCVASAYVIDNARLAPTRINNIRYTIYELPVYRPTSHDEIALGFFPVVIVHFQRK